MSIARILRFDDDVISFGPYFKKDDRNKGFQIDLIFQRSQNIITVCEIKYSENSISTLVIPEFQRKLGQLKVKRGVTVEKALITVNGADQSLYDADYFDYIISIEDLTR